jgi:hypothetical protein
VAVAVDVWAKAGIVPAATASGHTVSINRLRKLPAFIILIPRSPSRLPALRLPAAAAAPCLVPRPIHSLVAMIVPEWRLIARAECTVTMQNARLRQIHITTDARYIVI